MNIYVILEKKYGGYVLKIPAAVTNGELLLKIEQLRIMPPVPTVEVENYVLTTISWPNTPR
jgi:hypothetical protein